MICRSKGKCEAYDWQTRLKELNEETHAVVCLVPNIIHYCVDTGGPKEVWDIVEHGIEEYNESVISRGNTVQEAIELAFGAYWERANNGK